MLDMHEQRVPEYLYFRIEKEDVAERLKTLFFEMSDVLQEYFSIYDCDDIDGFTYKTDFEGFLYIVGVYQETESFSFGERRVPYGWESSPRHKRELIPDLTTKQGRSFALALEAKNKELCLFYHKCKEYLLDMIEWPLRTIELILSDDLCMDVDVSSFDIFVTQGNEDVYLRVNNPDYIRQPEFARGKVPVNVRHDVANILDKWLQNKSSQIIPATKREVFENLLPFSMMHKIEKSIITEKAPQPVRQRALKPKI